MPSRGSRERDIWRCRLGVRNKFCQPSSESFFCKFPARSSKYL
jgi:hypothetical protein